MVERRWWLPEDRKALTRKQRADLFIRQDGRCPNCTQRLETKGGTPVCVDEHLEPLWRGGKNELANRELWCVPCTKPKTAAESTQRGKALAVRDKHIGARKARRPFYCNENMKKTMSGSVVDRRTGRPWGERNEDE